MSRLSPRPRQRPRPALRRAALAPALLATIGILAGAKIVLLAQEALRMLAAPSVHEARVLTAEQTAPAEVEPGAGPREPVPAGPTAERQPDEPMPQAEATPATAGPARRLALGRLSQSEIEVLHQLAERRAALDRRERQLDRDAALLATAEADLAAQLERLERLRAEIAATVGAHDAKEEAELADLVKIYETMKPKAAAEIFNRLEMPILVQVVERMRAPKSADVLARMDPAKAKQVTAELARRTELLRAAGNG
jgi:flagellar motility protein MotE (MotC chaperone)